MMACCSIWRLALICLIFSLVEYAESMYGISVNGGSKKCMKFQTFEDSKISGNFELLEDYLDPDPLRFTITKIGNIHERQYDSEIGQDSGRFTFRDHGKFNICIENGVSRASDGKLRKVGFSIRVKPVYDDHDDSPGPMTEAVSRLDDLCDEVLDNLDHLLDKIELYKERERLHRDVSEKTFKNVWKWSFIEKFILMLVSISQVFYLKSYFSKSRGF